MADAIDKIIEKFLTEDDADWLRETVAEGIKDAAVRKHSRWDTYEFVEPKAVYRSLVEKVRDHYTAQLGANDPKTGKLGYSKFVSRIEQAILDSDVWLNCIREVASELLGERFEKDHPELAGL